MNYGMKRIDQPEQVDSIELAGALLRAWVKGDRPAFQVELDRSSRIAPDLLDTGESERLQMLNAIAMRIKCCADPFAWRSADPGIDVCVNLLSHLSRTQAPAPVSRGSWSVVRSARRSAALGTGHSRSVQRETLILH